MEKFVQLYVGCEVLTVDGDGVNLGNYYPEVWLKEGRVEPNGINVYFPRLQKVYVMNYGQCKLKLRPLDDITPDEFSEIKKLIPYHDLTCFTDGRFHYYEHEEVNNYESRRKCEVDAGIGIFPLEAIPYFLSKELDVFNLRKLGFAVNKTSELL